MNRKLLETFLWTARLGSFRAAADHLNSTQPAVSMRIRQLERELGVQLFERGTRASYLTGKGEEMLPYAERALHVMHEMQHRVADPSTIAETVRVGVAEFVAVTWLPELVREIAARFPAVSLKLDVDLTHGLVRKLRDRELDLALCIGPIVETDLKNISLGKVALGWFAGPQLGLEGKRVRPKDLAHIPMMSLSEDSGLHATALEWFRSANEHCRRIHLCNSMHTVSILVRAGQGFSLLPVEYCRFYMERGSMQRLQSAPAPPPAEYVALYYQSRTPPIVASIAQIVAAKSGFAQGRRR
jgi:DNA-binding transcriptional LysR family regulator